MKIVTGTQVNIRYRGPDGEVGSVQVPPEEVFETDPSEEVRSLFELVWRRQHASEFIGIPPRLLVATTLEAVCPATEERIVDEERFWASGTCRSILRREARAGQELSWLRIIEIGTPGGIHFVRFGSDSSDETQLLEHHLVLPNEDVQFFL